jgi:hypothetical protein
MRRVDSRGGVGGFGGARVGVVRNSKLVELNRWARKRVPVRERVRVCAINVEDDYGREHG